MERNPGATTDDTSDVEDTDDTNDTSDASTPQTGNPEADSGMDLSSDLTDALADTYITGDDGVVDVPADDDAPDFNADLDPDDAP